MKYINIKQHDTTDCGPACLAIIAKHYKKSVSIAELRERSGTNNQGTSIEGLSVGAESYGFRVDCLKSDQSNIDNMKNIPLPCIAHILKDNLLFHYVVILKIKKEKIVISDPANGILELPKEQFLNMEINKVDDETFKWTGILMVLRPTDMFESDMRQISPVIKLLKMLTHNKKICYAIVLVSILYTIINVGAAFYYKILIDTILPGFLVRSLTLISMAFILLAVAKTALSLIRVKMTLILGKKLNHELSLGFYKHILQLPQKFFDNRRVGEIVSRFQDATMIQETLVTIVLTVFVDILSVIGAGVILFIQNKAMFTVVFIMCIIYIVIALGFRKKYSKLNKKQLENEAETTATIVESLSGITTVKASNTIKPFYKMVEKKFDDYLLSVYGLGKLENFQYALKGWVGSIGEIVILWIGAIFIFLGMLTIGELITFNALLIYFFNPVRNLIDLQSQLQTSFVAIERLQEIINLSIEEDSSLKNIDKVNIKGNIVFNNISFSYDGESVLRDIDMKIEEGTTVALVGESGSGKSTIAKLLVKLYEPEKGTISIGGVDLKEVNPECIRNKIAYISQETFLFRGTIMDNLTLGMKDIKKEDVYQMCKIAHIHSFIMGLKLQYDTKLEENGGNLSGGQRQRLAIARALLRHPSILVMDEATSNLDFSTEKIIEDAIRNYASGITVIVIAHRMNIIKNCDLIYVINNGGIEEVGKYQELVNQGGTYL